MTKDTAAPRYPDTPDGRYPALAEETRQELVKELMSAGEPVSGMPREMMVTSQMRT
jgi:hypothetical protein